MVAADFILTPAVVFSENNAGGVGGAVGGLFGRKRPRSARWPAASSSRKRRPACWSPTRAAASRWRRPKAARRRPTCGSAARSSAAAAARPAAVTATPTKARSSRPPSWTTTTRSSASCATTPACSATSARSSRKRRPAAPKKAGAVFNEGDVLDAEDRQRQAARGQPSDTAKALATLARGDELVVIGAEKDGFINVQGATATGWVKIVLVQKR